MRIHRLSPDVANRIAAGEVVERPASVVKELVENSIDAGASTVVVEVAGGGLELIRVIDDGCGMSPEDAVLAFERHATSKIRDAGELDSIRTMGFRGEALPSVASVSRVSLTTREPGAEVGTEVRCEGPALGAPTPVGAPVGTTIEVRDLFFNTPARLKYLRTPATETRRIVEVMGRLALSHPNVSISLWVDGRETLHTPTGGSLRDSLASVLGVDAAKSMIPVDHEARGIHVRGFIGVPENARSGRDGQHVIVNGRPVTSKTVWSAIDRAYDKAAPQGRKPLVVLDIDLPSHMVDVNVHPAKTEVRFASDSDVFSAVHGAVTSGLRTIDAAPTMAPQPQPSREYHPLSPSAAFVWEPPHRLEDGEQAVSFEESDGNGVGAQPDVSSGVFRVIGQLARSYILVEGEQGLLIVDQHVAHERILVEQYRKDLASRSPQVQLLLTPEIISLGLADMDTVQRHSQVLSAMGFDVEPFGATAVAVRGIPAAAGKLGPVRALSAALEGICSAHISDDRASLADHVAVSLACHTAIKAGAVLERQEMDALVTRLMETEDPFRCPHGRPVITTVSIDQLERGFGRR